MKILNVALFFLFFSSNIFATDSQSDFLNPQSLFIEKLLVKSLENIQQGNLNEALTNIDSVIEKEPNFKLAHLIKGDIYLAHAKGLNQFGENSSNQEIMGFQDEAKKRITRYLSEQENLYQHNFSQVANSFMHLIYVDVTQSRLYLYKNENQQLSYVFDTYATIGKNGYDKNYEGDKKTPLGVYFIEGKLKRRLSDFYGHGAFPLNYPNELDKIQSRTGSGIWIHGTPINTYSRAPQASDGCIVIGNNDIDMLYSIIKDSKTPVIVSNKKISEYFAPSAENETIISKLNEWKSSWASLELKNYLDNYSPGAIYNDKKYETWVSYKKHVFENTKEAKITINNLSIFDYPELINNEIKLIQFNQDYESNLTKNNTLKTQIWKKINNEWKIIYESST